MDYEISKVCKLCQGDMTVVTKKILNNVSHSNRYVPSSFDDKSINKRWM